MGEDLNGMEEDRCGKKGEGVGGGAGKGVCEVRLDDCEDGRGAGSDSTIAFA